MNISDAFRVLEELDYFMRYLTMGLYPEPGQVGIASLPLQTDRLVAWSSTLVETGHLQPRSPNSRPSRACLTRSTNIVPTVCFQRALISLTSMEVSSEKLGIDSPTLRLERRMDGKLHTKFVGCGIAAAGRRRGSLLFSFARNAARDEANGEASLSMRLPKHGIRLDTLATVGVWDVTEALNPLVFNEGP